MYSKWNVAGCPDKGNENLAFPIILVNSSKLGVIETNGIATYIANYFSIDFNVKSIFVVNHCPLVFV